MTALRPVLPPLRAAAHGLSPALARIAESILAQPARVLTQTVTELAEQSGSSEASVIRLCREQGFTGFQDLKLALATELGAEAPVRARWPEGPTGLVDTAMTALRDTAALLDPPRIDGLADRLLAARRIHLFGAGASGVTTLYGFYKFTRLGLPAVLTGEAHLGAMVAAGLGPADIAFAVSTSGATIDTVRAAQRAHDAGAYVVAVTNRPKSPLTAVADAVLLAAWPESPLTGGAFPSKISQLLIFDLLFETVAARDAAARRAIQRTAESVSDRSY